MLAIGSSGLILMVFRRRRHFNTAHVTTSSAIMAAVSAVK
jgi:hypothetical protein